MNICVNDIVKFVDGSYTLTLKVGEKKLSHQYEGKREEHCKVIAINTPLPTEDSGIKDNLIQQNNCLVLAPNGDLIFCSKINIEKV